jgi:transposase InsO family protein
MFPQKPRVGIRANRPNQILQIDQTLLRIAAGSRIFNRAIIDNFSRYILSWQVSDNYGGTYSKELIQSAWQKLTASSEKPDPPNLFKTTTILFRVLRSMARHPSKCSLASGQ